MLLDRSLRSLLAGGLSSAAGRDSNTAGSPAPEPSPAAAPTRAMTGPVGRDGCAYLLTRPEGPVDGGGPGWRLSFTATEGPSWSMVLTGRGAGAQTPPRVAQAVAVRVLAEFGIDVRGWEPGHRTQPGPRASGSSPRYRAVLAPIATPADLEPAPSSGGVQRQP